MSQILNVNVKNINFSKLFWKYLFMPDVLTKLIFFQSLKYNEFITNSSIMYYVFFGLTVFTCIYFPIMYVYTWVSASAYKGEVDWSVLAKIYIILSLSISNVVHIVVGAGKLVIFH